MNTVANILYNARIENNLTIPILSKKSGVSSSYISRIENNKRKPSAKILKKLALALDLDYLILLKQNKLLEKQTIDLGCIFKNNVCKYNNNFINQTLINKITNFIEKELS